MNIKSLSSTLSTGCMLKSDMQKLTAALTLGVLSLGFVPAAAAISTYSSSAELTITLSSVKDLNNNEVGAAGNWLVSTTGGLESFLDTSTTGDGVVSVINTLAPPTSLDPIGGSVNQASNSSGSASNGSSFADTLTDLVIDVENIGGAGDLTFVFDLIAVVNASITGGTNALDDFTGSQVILEDNLGGSPIDIFSSAEIEGTDGDSLIGSYSFSLQEGEMNTLEGFVDSWGQITAVPVPAAVWLFGSGLIGLVGVARRKK